MDAPDPSRDREARRLGELLLPDMPYEDRLKVAEVSLSTYGRIAVTYPVDHERIRTEIYLELERLRLGGEEWAGEALSLYVCKVCQGRRVHAYSPEGHRSACGVTTGSSDARSIFHRASKVQYFGGSWGLNVYIAECGTTNLTNGNKGRIPCPDCFR
jgi:hypothetical protein